MEGKGTKDKEKLAIATVNVSRSFKDLVVTLQIAKGTMEKLGTMWPLLEKGLNNVKVT